RVDLDDADGGLLPRRDNRIAYELTPVIGNRKHIRRREIEPLDPAEVEQLVLDHRTADEAAPPLLIERRRRRQEDRLAAGIVAARERRLVELVVAKESVAAAAQRVRAAARDHVQHPAGRLAVLGAEGIRQHLELLNPVLREVVGLPAVELHLI